MEKYLVLYCAPTLAGMKTANLFSYTFASKEILNKDVYNANKILNVKGIFAEVLQTRENTALIFVYRLSMLEDKLMQDRVREFLSVYGYRTDYVGACIFSLKKRFSSHCKFPHEVGLFLGYPLDDVIDFIKNEGKNSICTGCWKVYRNECEAVRLFDKYEKCKNVYTRLFFEGRSIGRLIVAV